MENQLKIIASKKTIKILVVITAVGFVLSIFWMLNSFLSAINYYNQSTIVIAGQEIKVKLVKTSAEKELGLSGVKTLPTDEGKLFVYDSHLVPSFWMKDMLIPIDIIWIKDDMVIGFETNLQPPANNIDLPIYQPKTFINYVLEVNAGFVDKYDLKIGDIVKINF